jgi:hypothetical protein
MKESDSVLAVTATSIAAHEPFTRRIIFEAQDLENRRMFVVLDRIQTGLAIALFKHDYDSTHLSSKSCRRVLPSKKSSSAVMLRRTPPGPHMRTGARHIILPQIRRHFGHLDAAPRRFSRRRVWHVAGGHALQLHRTCDSSLLRHSIISTSST